MIKRFKIIFDKMHDEGSAGGGGSDGKVDDKQTPPASASALETGGDDIETDDFGYPIEKPIAPAPEQKTPEKAAAKSEQKTEAIKSSTGYEEDIVIEAEVPPVIPPEKPGSVQEKLGFELEFGDMDKAQAEKVTDFAKANGLTKEAAQAFVNLKNSENAAQKAAEIAREAELEKAVVKLKSDWQKELKSDASFGGEKYAQSVKNVDRVLTDFMPGIKKSLTDGKRMLPPIVMKDFAKLAEHLYASEKITQGEPPAKEESTSDDPLDFYS